MLPESYSQILPVENSIGYIHTHVCPLVGLVIMDTHNYFCLSVLNTDINLDSSVTVGSGICVYICNILTHTQHTHTHTHTQDVIVFADERQKNLKVFCVLCEQVFDDPYVTTCGVSPVNPVGLTHLNFLFA